MMEQLTKLWTIHIEHPNWRQSLQEAADLLAAGKQVAFPTETVYGLGGDATNSDAVAGIFQAKGRPSDNPLIVHISHINQLSRFVQSYDGIAELLMQKFWPGPLTIVLPVKEGVLSPLVTAGLSTVGVRMPDHPVALAIIEQSGRPIAAPSANVSGRPSPTMASHVREDLDGKIAGIVDGGATGVGLESTVVEIVDDNVIRILRPGAITMEMLQQAVPKAIVAAESQQESIEAPRSPGMKYTHYAPKGSLVVVKGEPNNVSQYIQEQLTEHYNESCGVLAFEERVPQYSGAELVLSLGREEHLEEAAATLYDALRQFDEQGISYIWSEASSSNGIGAALMNRLHKAAGHVIIEV